MTSFPAGMPPLPVVSSETPSSAQAVKQVSAKGEADPLAVTEKPPTSPEERDPHPVRVVTD